MPNKKISQLDQATSTSDVDKLLITQSGANKSSSVSVTGTRLNSVVSSSLPTYSSLVSALKSGSASNSATSKGLMTQDIGAVDGTLHSSPNTITSMFIYDTSKDSDGGAWTTKCQNTSWYNETLSGKWLGARASESAARSVSGATTGDYYQSTVDGKFYSLNATSGTTEVFRGNKRDFPKLSAIVAEASNLTIYDLTESGRPMWRRFYQTSSSDYNSFMPATIGAITALHGDLLVGMISSTGNQGGILKIQFPLDNVIRHYNGTSQSAQLLGIATSNSRVFSPNSISTQLSIPSIYSIVAISNPDEPIQSTGLRNYTFTYGGGNGFSIIRSDYTKIDLTFSSPMYAFIDAKNSIWELGTDYGGSWGIRQHYGKRFDTVTVYGGYPTAGNTPVFTNMNTDQGTARKAVKTSDFNVINWQNSLDQVSLFKTGTVDTQKTLTAFIKNSFNTGWLTSKIRRTYLSDITPESISNTELLIDYSFDDPSKWVANAAVGASVSGGSFKFDGITIASNPIEAIRPVTSPTFVIGKTYAVVIVVTAGTISGFDLNIGGAISPIVYSVPGTYTYTFVATTTTGVQIRTRLGSSARDQVVSSLSIKEVVADRSYKSQSAAITGTLTKSPVATSAQLVGYSGFSNSNYLREPYSSDLDFGIGEWNASAWVNIPTTLNSSSLIQIGNNLVTNGDFSTNNMSGWTVGSNLSPTVFNQRCTLAVNSSGTGLTNWTYQRVTHNNSGYLIKIMVTIYEIDAGATVSFGSSNNLFNNYDLGLTITSPGTYEIVRTTQSNTCDVGIYISGVVGSKVTWGAMTTKVISDLVITERSDQSNAKFSVKLRPNLIWGSTSYVGQFVITAYDGTNTRTVTSTASYNTGTWIKVETNYTSDGTLSLLVNGQKVNSTTGTPLLTLNNSNAVLTIGNSYDLTAPFPGSIALLKLSATVPTPEQSQWMYEQEKFMFQPGAQVCLPSSGAVNDLAYDSTLNKWIAVQGTHKSEWNGLVRTSYTKAASGSYSKIAADSGIQLAARSGIVDIQMDAIKLKDELMKPKTSLEASNSSIFEFDSISFTATATAGSLTTLTGVTSIVGTPFVGMAISATNIPVGTTITAISGTTYTISQAATAGTTTVSQTDYQLPVGYQASAVYLAGIQKKEGVSGSGDYIRLFDGFRETIRFNTAPGSSQWIKIRANRTV